MQEEINQKTVAIILKSGRFTMRELRSAMNEAQRKMEQSRQRRQQKSVTRKNAAQGKAQTQKKGKMSVRDLVGQGQGATNIEIKNDDIKVFERICRKYNVDYAIQKDKTTVPPQYLVFFKGKDTDVISQAFKEYVQKTEKRKSRPSLRKSLEQKKGLVDKYKSLAKAKNLLKHKQKERWEPSL